MSEELHEPIDRLANPPKMTLQGPPVATPQGIGRMETINVFARKTARPALPPLAKPFIQM